MQIHPILLETIFSEELFTNSVIPTVIIDQRWEKIHEPERVLLEKILTAIRQSLNSIVVKYQSVLNLAELPGWPLQVIYFGQPVKGVPLYEVIEANAVTLVASESLRNLSQDDEARKKLWQALKKQFSL